MTYGCAPDLSVYDNLASIYLDNKKYVKGGFVNKKVLSAYVKAVSYTHLSFAYPSLLFMAGG